MSQTRYRLAVDTRLTPGAEIVLEGNAAHYLANVLRLKAGDSVALFNRTDGEWRAELSSIAKKSVMLTAVECTRSPATPLPFIVCFAPIKGGRLETIIEKATELGASVLQPVITRRTIVDKVNLDRANAIAREAAEQCERIDWPEICPPIKLEKLLADWPADTPLFYGDETGGGVAITELFRAARPHPEFSSKENSDLSQGRGSLEAMPCPTETSPLGEVQKSLGFSGEGVQRWGIFAGPEGGFAPDELALLKRTSAAKAVSLGPRILRADTAIITLAALTLAAFGDWHQPPRFSGDA